MSEVAPFAKHDQTKPSQQAISQNYANGCTVMYSCTQNDRRVLGYLQDMRLRLRTHINYLETCPLARHPVPSLAPARLHRNKLPMALMRGRGFKRAR